MNTAGKKTSTLSIRPRFDLSWSIGGLAVLLVIASEVFVSGNLLSRGTMSTLTPLIGILVLVGIGQAFVIGTGGIDLSVPATMTLMGAIVLKQSEGKSSHLTSALILCAVASIVIGLVNGILIQGLRLNPLVVTLAVGQLVTGYTEIYRGAVPSVQHVSSNLATAASSSVGGVSDILIGSILFAAVVAFALRRVVAGRRLTASSTSEKAAIYAGLKASTYRIAAYVVAALMYGIGGVLAAGQIQTPDLTLGEPYLLTSIVAVVLGGAALAGSKVSPVATAYAAVFILVLDFDLRIEGASAGVRQITQGMVLVIALAVLRGVQRRDQLGGRLRKFGARFAARPNTSGS